MPKSPLGEAISKIISKVVFIPKVSLNATPKGKAVCGESRTHGLEGVVEGRPSTTTLLFVSLVNGDIDNALKNYGILKIPLHNRYLKIATLCLAIILG